MHDVADIFAKAAERQQIIAEDLHRDIGARTGQHVVDPVRNRLTDRDVRTGQRRETPAQLGEQLGARPTGFAQADVDLGGLNALNVFVVFRATGAASRCHDFWLREKDLFDAASDLVRLREATCQATYSPGPSTSLR